MKAFSLFLLCMLISLYEAARPNLRFLRSIPNRTPRNPTNQSSKESKRSQLSDEPREIEDNNRYVGTVTAMDDSAIGIISSYFDSNRDFLNELLDIFENTSEEALLDAIKFCTKFKNFTYDQCKKYIELCILPRYMIEE